MLSRRRMLMVGGAALAWLQAAPSGAAVVRQRFTADVFSAAKAAGKPILIEVGAPWCPVCRVQKIVLAPLLAQPRFRDILVLEIDYDSQKEAMHLVNARLTSTLIVFRGEDEMARSLGDTNPESLESFLGFAL